MKSKTIGRLIVIGIVFCLSITPIFACSIDPTPLFELKTSNVERCFFKSYNETISVDVVDFIKERDSPYYQDCKNLTLSQNDKAIFKQTIERFNKEFYLWEHVYIQEQSNQEYINFLNVTEEKNANRCDCDKFSNISREGNWTIYKRGSACSSICGPSPPDGCFIENIAVHNSTSPIVIIIIGLCIFVGLCIGLIFLVRFFVKTPKKK